MKKHWLAKKVSKKCPMKRLFASADEDPRQRGLLRFIQPGHDRRRGTEGGDHRWPRGAPRSRNHGIASSRTLIGPVEISAQPGQAGFPGLARYKQTLPEPWA